VTMKHRSLTRRGLERSRSHRVKLLTVMKLLSTVMAGLQTLRLALTMSVLVPISPPRHHIFLQPRWVPVNPSSRTVLSLLRLAVMHTRPILHSTLMHLTPGYKTHPWATKIPRLWLGPQIVHPSLVVVVMKTLMHVTVTVATLLVIMTGEAIRRSSTMYVNNWINHSVPSLALRVT
jgi:hypothetical protein